MPPLLFLLLLLKTVYASLPQIGDGQLKLSARKLTVSQNVNVSTLFSTNPLLKRLPMFADSEATPQPHSRGPPAVSSTPFPVDRKVFSRSPGDNFHALYKRLNESLFKMGKPSKKLKNEQAESLSDRFGSEEETFPEEGENDEPFAVTETLLDSLKPQVTAPSWEDNTWDGREQQPPATRTFSPVPETSPEIVETRDEAKELNRPLIAIDLHSGEVDSSHQKKGLLSPLRRASDWQVHPSGSGRFLVSGTQFYRDNRIDGGILTDLPHGNEIEEHEGIRMDKAFAIEDELTQMRAHAAALKKMDRPLARAAKTVTLGSSGVFDTGRRTDRYAERPYPSKVQIIERNGRKVEIRKIDRHGHEVQVELMNPILWNHDYISSPGSIIHGRLKKNPKRFKLATISKCFELIEDTRLAGVLPLDRRIGNSAMECLKMCTRTSSCHTAVFEETLSMCEIYAERAGDKGSSFQQSPSSILFEPIVEDPERCLASAPRARKRLHAAPIKPANIAPCPQGEEYILTRQEGVRTIDGQVREKFSTNEDDCVSACLAAERSCLAAGYSHHSQECVLYSRINTAIEVHEPATLYKKMCASQKTAAKCAGATVDHVKQAVLLSSMREAKSVRNRTACLDECIRASFTCLSTMYYPKEAMNCILNDGALSTAPDSFVEELEREVEYFGMEECYGIQDVTQRGKSYLVEDDIRPGQVTQGSRIDALKRWRRRR